MIDFLERGSTVYVYKNIGESEYLIGQIDLEGTIFRLHQGASIKFFDLGEVHEKMKQLRHNK